MGITISMIMIAAGAIMRFAVTAQGHGINVHTTGMVLMVVGAISAVLSVAFWASWGGFNRRTAGAMSTTTGNSTTVRETEVRAQP